MNVAALALAYLLGFVTPYLIHWLDWTNTQRRKRRREARP